MPENFKEGEILPDLNEDVQARKVHGKGNTGDGFKGWIVFL